MCYYSDMNKNDLRYIKTDELIISSFLECAKAMPFHDIRINDICSRARISRNAFYTHYEDKYHLLDYLYKDIEDKMLANLTQAIIDHLAKDIVFPSSKWCIEEIYKYREMLSILTNCSTDRFRLMIQRVYIDGTLAAIIENPEEVHNDIICRMTEAYLSDSLVSILLIWLENTDKLTKEEVTDLLYEIFHKPVCVFYRKLHQNSKIKFI